MFVDTACMFVIHAFCQPSLSSLLPTTTTTLGLCIQRLATSHAKTEKGRHALGLAKQTSAKTGLGSPTPMAGSALPASGTAGAASAPGWFRRNPSVAKV